jgi:peptidoglycan-associated lipoprotein
MGKKILTDLNVLVVLCLTLLVMAACANKQVQVSPTTPTDVTAEETAVIETGPDVEMTDADEIRRKRLEALQAEEADLRTRLGDIFSEKIYFEFDRYDLSAKARTILKKIAAALRANPSSSIDIAGHCDERGTIEYNLALGERRARSAEKFLKDLGISGDRISTVSYGEERPVDTSTTEEAWAKNRRNEFTLIK